MFNVGPQEVFVLMLIMMLGLVMLLPWFKICTRAGFSGWWCLVFVVPGLNLIALFYLAFAEWPVLRGRNTTTATPTATSSPTS